MDNMKFSYKCGSNKTVVSLSSEAPWREAVDRFVDFLQASGYIVGKGQVGAYLLGETEYEGDEDYLLDEDVYGGDEDDYEDQRDKDLTDWIYSHINTKHWY